MDKRTVLALVLCFVIFVGWTSFVQPLIWPRSPRKPVPQQAKKTPDGKERSEPKPRAREKPKTEPPPPPKVPERVEPLYEEDEPIKFTTSRFTIVLTNRGAGIKRLVLHYPDQGDDVPLLLPHEERWPHVALHHVDGPDSIESLNWKVEEITRSSVRFSYPLKNGVTIEKTFLLDPERHRFTLRVLVTNKGVDGAPPEEQSMKLRLLAFNGLAHDGDYRYEQYFKTISLYQGGLESTYLGEVEGEKEGVKQPAANTRWAGLKNRFFACVVMPEQTTAQRILDEYTFKLSGKKAREKAGSLKNVDLTVHTQEFHVGDQPVALNFDFFLGPLRNDALADIPQGDKILTYDRGCGEGCPVGFLGAPIMGVVGLIAPAILWTLNLMGGAFGNYGVGIILTTILIRLCLFPLSKKSQVSMFRMQQLGPKIKVIKERYKDDQRKFQAEQMKLFKDNGVNPLSGCLPILLQLPIFISMFSVFDMAIELRQAPFMLWISDLSQPDRALTWAPVPIPIISMFTDATIDSLNILPLLMMVTWFLQAYMAPRNPDPQVAAQQKMFMFMPILFGFICYGYASGLSLYFFINSLLAMGEQKLIKKFFLKPDSDIRKA